MRVGVKVVEEIFVARMVGASLLSVALFITAFIKKNALISTVIVIMAFALFLLLSKV